MDARHQGGLHRPVNLFKRSNLQVVIRNSQEARESINPDGETDVAEAINAACQQHQEGRGGEK
jgi:hypothetical protein